MFVGIAPGAVEVEEGTSFTGPSGQLLQRVLTKVGIDSDDYFLTNAVACHPPFKKGVKPMDPPKEVIKACRPRLDAEVEYLQPETIVSLGNIAKEVVFEVRDGITKFRKGPPRPTKYGIDGIPTLHPAACLRNSDSFPDMAKDIGKLKDDIWSSFTEPTFKVYDTEEEAIAVLDAVEKAVTDVCALDIEVGVEKDSDFSHPDSLLSVGLSWAENKAVVLGEEACNSERVRQALRRFCEHTPILCHNGKFDIQVLIRMGVLESTDCLAADTMLASYCLDERPGHHGLKYLGSEVLGAPDWDDEIHIYTDGGGSFSLIPRPILYKYNAYDAAITYRMWRYFVPRLAEAELRRVHDRLVEYSRELIYVELDGVKVDIDYMNELTESYHDTLEPLKKELKSWVQNPNSPKQVKEALAEVGLNVESTNQDTLEGLLKRQSLPESIPEFLTLMLKWRRENKLYGTYVKGLRKRLVKDRVYSTFLLHGSVTGRTASRNPNLQNVPRESAIRRQFVPEQGNVFVQADYKAVELRVIAVEAQDEWLQDLFSDPSRDIHSEVATRLIGPDFTKEDRVRAKAIVYGLSYGREAYSIAQEYSMPVPQAEQYMRDFFKQIPGVVDWIDWVQQQVKGSQGLTTHFGRKRRFWLITNENIKDVYKEAQAFVPQSTANDINLTALCRLRREFGNEWDGVQMRMPVHDSIMVECPEYIAKDVAVCMEEVMEETAAEIYSDRVAFPVDAQVGRTWGDLD